MQSTQIITPLSLAHLHEGGPAAGFWHSTVCSLLITAVLKPALGVVVLQTVVVGACSAHLDIAANPIGPVRQADVRGERVCIAICRLLATINDHLIQQAHAVCEQDDTSSMVHLLPCRGTQGRKPAIARMLACTTSLSISPL